MHANGIYSCLRGDIDNRSLDCFGAAVSVVIGMNVLGHRRSTLTLSEDHAYESHECDCDDDARRRTCEVAIAGNTNAIRARRGGEISSSSTASIAVGDSWLYMARNPVLCRTPIMVLAAMISNINCDIGKHRTSSTTDRTGRGGGATGPRAVVSLPLYRMKRDMLWILHDRGAMTTFPFALMELGECEEHVGSPRGMEWVDASEMLQCGGGGGGGGGSTTLVLRNEKLFLDAIHVSRTVYGDGQVYPYLYCGHYHRDAGRDDGEEYRLVESLRLYAEAARVASSYRYDARDCLQLMKHFTTVTSLIVCDILLSPTRDRGGGIASTNDVSREWRGRDNAIAAATWLIGFFDSLLLWEEREQNAFVEVLGVGNKNSMARLFQHFAVDIRLAAIQKIQHQDEPGDNNMLAITEDRLIHFRNPRSKRLAGDSLLVVALSKGKVAIRESELALPSTGEVRSCRQRKKARS